MPKTLPQLLALIGVCVVAGAVFGSSVAMGLCSVVYLVHRH
jgi:hypothetical protein